MVVFGMGCHAPGARAPAAASSPPSVRGIALPGAPAAGGVLMDYIAYDRAHDRVWVPAGDTGSVDVLEVKSLKVTRIEGFPTTEVERRGRKRTVGPSSATVGEGLVYVGNRGDSSVCAIDAASLHKRDCLRLDSMPDGLAYVAPTHEVWVTTPRNQSIVILKAQPGGLTAQGKITFEGDPEGFAVDASRGRFYTNLEDKDRTLAIDIRSRKVVATWLPSCGEDGPKGLALDHDYDFLFVACPDHVIALDAGHDGKLLSSITTGPGLDNIDYVAPRHELYAAAARAGKLTVAKVDAQGNLTPVAVVDTAPGARNAVATDEGTAFVTDSPEGKLLVVTH